MYFPVFMDLRSIRILVAGGGRIAGRRIRTLIGFSDHITVAAPEISEEILELQRITKAITIKKKYFEPSDLDGVQMVLAATDHSELNKEIYLLCKERSILVNVCSDQSLCDFQFPSIVKEGDLVIGINAAGTDHRMVKETRQKIESVLNVSKENSIYT